jgi:peptidylprolyl isomerase
MMQSSLLVALALVQTGNLVIKDTLIGKGPRAGVGDVLTMLYRGTLKDGTVFDENSKKAPFVFKLGGGEVIRGWDVGLADMKQGGKRHLEIPPSMAYGDREVGPIPKNSTLYFDVELLRIDRENIKPTVEIKDLTVGKGPAAKSGDTVDVHYTGSFLNGVKFDSSYDHKDDSGKSSPFSVPLGVKKVIPGFEQGLLGMKVGGKRHVVIPYALAYGERVVGNGLIPSRSTLVFDLELMAIQPKKQ